MEMVLGLMGILLSLVVFVVSKGYDIYMYDVVGGGGFPRMLAGIMILCCIGMIAQAAAAGRAGKESRKTGDNKTAFLLVVGVLIYILLLETVGYLSCMIVLVAYLLWIQGERNPKVLGASTVVICGLLYVIFVLILRVKLPTGFLI